MVNRLLFSWNRPKKDNFDIYVKLVGEGNPLRLTTDSLPDIRPAWSPDGNQVAFIREFEYRPGIQLPKEIYIIPALGGREQKVIDFHPGLIEQPSISWSIDAKFIYYSDWSIKDDGFVIKKVSIETNQVEQITSLPHGVWGDQSPRISHDGNYVAFLRGQPRVREIYIMNIFNNEMKQITDNKNWIDGFTWGSNDKSILFSSNLDGTSSLWKIDLSAGSQQKILTGININDPFVSSAGNRIVFAETIVNSNIWKIDLKNPKKESLLISSSFNNEVSDISPDGKKIIFSSNRTGSYNIWMGDKDGINQTQLTYFDNLGNPGDAKWSPDGSEIIISNKNGTYLLNASGGAPQKIADPLSFIVWSKNGQGIYSMVYPDNNIYFFTNGKKRKQVTKNGGIVPYVYGNYIYYLKDWDHHDIWRVPLDGGEEKPVLQGITDIELRSWVVAKKGIYFIRSNNNSPILELYNFNTKEIVHIKDIPMAENYFVPIAIDPAETYLLYSKREPNKSDIILVDNFRTSN